MQSEIATNTQLLYSVEQIIAAKAWYGLTDTGGFNWPASVGRMTESLRSELSWDRPDLFETVRGALEAAFTPDCLTRVDQELFVTKLAELAHAHRNDLIVWTVGDVGWQINKAERTGIFDLGVSRKNFRATPENKREGLLTILQEIRAQKPGDTPLHVYVLDDKETSIADVRSLAANAAALNIVPHDFLVKADTLGATPTDTYAYLERELVGLEDTVFIISDYDGVLANTDKALKELGARNILTAFVRSATP